MLVGAQGIAATCALRCFGQERGPVTKAVKRLLAQDGRREVGVQSLGPNIGSWRPGGRALKRRRGASACCRASSISAPGLHAGPLCSISLERNSNIMSEEQLEAPRRSRAYRVPRSSGLASWPSRRVSRRAS